MIPSNEKRFEKEKENSNDEFKTHKYNVVFLCFFLSIDNDAFGTWHHMYSSGRCLDLDL